MAHDPLIFYAILLRAVRGPILEIFIKKIQSRFFLNSHEVEIPIKPHVKYQKIISSD
jgi:hypothetical protein